MLTPYDLAQLRRERLSAFAQDPRNGTEAVVTFAAVCAGDTGIAAQLAELRALPTTTDAR